MAAESSSPSSSTPSAKILQFLPFESKIDAVFWENLSDLKLDTLGIDESPIPITGFYSPCSHPSASKPLTLHRESFESSVNHGDRNKCPVPGTLINTNTLESYEKIDKDGLLNAEAKKIWEDINSGRAEDDCALLSRFLLVTFADLKKSEFNYWFAFPALVLDPPATLVSLRPAVQCFTLEEAKSLKAACNEWRSTAGVPFFLISIASDSNVAIRPLRDLAVCQGNGQKLLFGFYDPCHSQKNPGWPLRNFLALISARWNMEKVRFLCYRENRGFADLGLSLVGEALISAPQGRKDPQYMPKAVGWELFREKGDKEGEFKFISRSTRISLAQSMDPTELAKSAADLNLKLMKWRALPSLNLNSLSTIKCLLIGAGTLGCQVARMLMAWGVRKITLLDSGRVAMSNPLRQSLYTLDDCLKGGKNKSEAAVESLKRIFPSVEAKSVVMAIPMPGHSVPDHDVKRVLKECRDLQDLIASHDVVFLLTDTRESRWLPTLLCADSNKITITAGLGFDSYVVMRHGAGPLTCSSNVKSEAHDALSTQIDDLSTEHVDGRLRLGCYFCNDVVAPIDSTANRTLDQQCTVTRPGLAPIASAIAVELLVGILHHPDGILAPGENATAGSASSEQPLGILPHQIRGSLSQFNQMTLVGHSSNYCTACSSTVVSEYRRRGMDFVLDAVNKPTYLEDLTGLTELMKSMNTLDVDWDDEPDENAGDML